jgi:2'-5' RNA ligase
VRLFVAIFPPEDARAHLRGRITDALAPGGRRVRLTPPERWHLTLSFLGEVDPERLPDVHRAMDDVPTAGSITLRMSGGGSFGRGRSAPLWVGIEGDLEALAGLHAGIRDGLAGAGLPYETRPLTPHLTVAYAHSPELREALSGYAGPSWTADEYVLVHSRHAERRGYEILRAWPLG